MDETSSTKALAPVLERTLGRAGILTLNRPEAGNRLTPAMRASLATTLQRHERDREIYCTVLEAAQAAEGGSAAFCLGDDGEGYAGIADAAAGAWRIDRHGKPFVAMLRGPVAGAGLGLVLHGTHQVAGEAVTLAVPEVTAGTVPGAGLSLLLPDMPGQLGLFLALTGRPIDHGLAFDAGLLTHCVASRQFPTILAQLADAVPLDPVLDALHEAPGRSSLAPHLDAIERCFGAETPAAIMARLESTHGASATWAAELAQEMRCLPPLALAVTHWLLTTHRPRDLRAALGLEYRVAMNLLQTADDPAPATDDRVEAMFAPLASGELVLPSEPLAPSIN